MIKSLFVLAAVFLLVAALSVLWSLGYRQRVMEQGGMFQREASHLVHSMNLILRRDISNLRNLTLVGDFAPLLTEESNRMSEEDARALAGRLDALWADLPESGEEVQKVTHHPLAGKLKIFQEANAFHAELLLTDRYGRMVAATGKSTDYDQADEAWWQQTMELGRDQALVSGLEYDQSAKVFSVDISLPVMSGKPGERPVGVLKAVIDVSPLFANLPVFSTASGAVGEVITPDGRILLRLMDRSFSPGGESISAEAVDILHRNRSGWFLAPVSGDEQQMVGYSPIRLLGVFSGDSNVSGDPFYVLVHRPAFEVLAPLRNRILLLMAAGSLIIAVSAVGGIYLVKVNVLDPLNALGNAASAMAATVGRKSRSNRQSGLPSNAHEALREVAAIRTGDEVEDFAVDFSTMSERLLRYQEDLQTELQAKTHEIQADLAMARDFQQALLPRLYPSIPTRGENDTLTLNFHHVYQAALSVSGDFFDVIKLNDHCAGVLVADVMGHGTRSALVTAILRALVHGLVKGADDPALFLSTLNRHFYETMKQADQVIFVSACYVVFDTEEESIRCASAGHPSPLMANRLTRKVEALYPPLRKNPALGLFPDSTYSVFRHPLLEGSMLLMFTDGIIEAANDQGKDFGVDRLVKSMGEHLDKGLASFTESILEDVVRFTKGAAPADDLCLVSVEAMPAGRERGTPIRRKALPTEMVEL